MRHDMIQTKKISDIYLDTSKEKLDQPKLIKYKPKTKSLIDVVGVTKTFGKSNKVIAVNDISLSFYDKQNTALLGANGAGKTTLVEMIVGINQPTKGHIKYNYNYINHFQEQIGIQFQDSTYPYGLKVKNVIEFMIDIYNVKISKDELDHMITMFGLKQYWKTFARSLSGGQQQRLNILLALLHKPKIIFLDELSTGLDISVREQIVSFVREYCAKHNINIILISHDISEVELICERIIIMQKGFIKVDISKKQAISIFGSVTNLLRKYI